MSNFDKRISSKSSNRVKFPYDKYQGVKADHGSLLRGLSINTLAECLGSDTDFNGKILK